MLQYMLLKTTRWDLRGQFFIVMLVCPIVREPTTQLSRRTALRMRSGRVCVPPPSSETDSPLAAPAHRQWYSKHGLDKRHRDGIIERLLPPQRLLLSRFQFLLWMLGVNSSLGSFWMRLKRLSSSGKRCDGWSPATFTGQLRSLHIHSKDRRCFGLDHLINAFVTLTLEKINSIGKRNVEDCSDQRY